MQVSDRLGPFMEGLDVPAVVLLTSQRLVATAAAAVTGTGGAGSSGSGVQLAVEPGKRTVEEARLSVGMALAHVAQRLGHAHLSRRGLFGFGSQQVRPVQCSIVWCGEERPAQPFVCSAAQRSMAQLRCRWLVGYLLWHSPVVWVAHLLWCIPYAHSRPQKSCQTSANYSIFTVLV